MPGSYHSVDGAIEVADPGEVQGHLQRPLQEPWTSEGSDKAFFKCGKKRTINPEFCCQRIRSLRIKGESRHSQVKEK